MVVVGFEVVNMGLCMIAFIDRMGMKLSLARLMM